MISRRVFLKNGSFALVSLGFAPSFLARTAFAAGPARRYRPQLVPAGSNCQLVGFRCWIGFLQPLPNAAGRRDANRLFTLSPRRGALW